LLAIVFLAVLVFVGTLVLAFLARPEHVVRLVAQAKVAEDGSAKITETINYRFAGFQKHGIYRDVPGLAAETIGITATQDGQPAQVLVTSNDFAQTSAHIRIGDPSRTISGDHTYVVSYPLPAVIDVAGNLDWNGVGTGWAVDIDEADLAVAGPWKWTEPTCQRGGETSTTPCTVAQPVPGLLEVDVEGLGPHQGVTISAGKGPRLAAAPSLPTPGPVRWPPLGTSPFVPAFAAAAAVLLAGLAMRGLLERFGRDEVVGMGATDVAFADDFTGSARRISAHELAGLASIEFAPPKELTAWQGGILSTEEVLDAQKVAWLLEAATAGHISLDEQDKSVTLTRLPAPPAGAAAAPPDDTAQLLDVAFAGRASITLGSYDPSFAAMWREVGVRLSLWRNTSDLWEQRSRSRQTAARAFGVLAALSGLAGIAGATFGVARHGSKYLPLVVVAGALAGLGLAAVTAGFELMVRTPKGSGLWVRVESFRRFLHDSEGPQAEEAAKRGVLRQYTAWAIALDEVRHWSKAVEAAGADIGSVDRSGLGFVYLAPLLMTSTQSTSVAPHSSGGIGGGVGGGFGGGGGGSW
jgi:Predicted membrane protein (DUF2207)